MFAFSYQHPQQDVQRSLTNVLAVFAALHLSARQGAFVRIGQSVEAILSSLMARLVDVRRDDLRGGNARVVLPTGISSYLLDVRVRKQNDRGSSSLTTENSEDTAQLAQLYTGRIRTQGGFPPP